MHKNLSVNFCGLNFKNPFIIAASPASDSREKVERAFEAGWGGAVLKTTSMESEPVNLVYPMMGSFSYKEKRHSSFYNIDLISERHIGEIEKDIYYLKLKYPDHIVMGSIMASSKSDWVELVHRLEAVGTDIIECSMSCPQGESNGMIPTTDPDLTKKVTNWIKEATRKNTPVIVKLSPMVNDIVAIAKAAKEGGADAICAIDTVKALGGINLNTLEPFLSVNGKSTFGGLSGPCVKPIALGCIAEIAKNVKIPISGVGGITSWNDAAEYLLLGARTLQICTAVMRYGFEMIDDLCDGLSNYMEIKGFNSVNDMVGRSLNDIINHDSLNRDIKIVSSFKKDLCVKDKLCYVACRDGGNNAISIDEEEYPLIDEKKCKGCGLCISVCPVPNCMELKKFN